MKCHPVFLVGAGRSGTTLLYKILCLHAGVAYISNYHKSAPDWVPAGLLLKLISPFPGLKRKAWFEQGGNAYSQGKRPWMKRLVPCPVEGERIYSGCGLSSVPPHDYRLSVEVVACIRRRFDRMAAFSGGKLFLSKRTSNNQRLPWLWQVFPQARFIHLIRDGRAVAYSLPRVGWWEQHQVWWAGRTPQELKDAGEDPLVISAHNWVADVRAVQSGLLGLPAGNVHELRYESLMENPVVEVRRILDFLGLPWTRAFAAALNSLDIKQRIPAWQTGWNKTELATVTHEQHPLLTELGYV